MGGAGAGHKSARARGARLVNMAKARAARKRAPLPWRSAMESRIIEQLVWQWWMTTSGEWLVASGENKTAGSDARPFVPQGEQVTLRKIRSGQASGGKKTVRSGQWSVSSGHPDAYIALRATGRVNPAPTKARDGSGTRQGGQAAGRPWAKHRVARFLGVSHTWVNKLVRRFEADPDRVRRRMAAFAPASFEKLERAREETRRQRERGWLRGPIRRRRVKVMIEGRKRTVVVATRAERVRWQAEVEGERARLRQGYGASSGQALREGRVETQRDSASRAGRVNSAPTKASATPVWYSELPQWAKGLLPPAGGAEVMRGHGPATAGRPRAVPFAFRRRR